jgi:hypothetical protein
MLDYFILVRAAGLLRFLLQELCVILLLLSRLCNLRAKRLLCVSDEFLGDVLVNLTLRAGSLYLHPPLNEGQETLPELLSVKLKLLPVFLSVDLEGPILEHLADGGREAEHSSVMGFTSPGDSVSALTSTPIPELVCKSNGILR